MRHPIILFRFSERFDVCRERVELLAALNPGVPIYAVYGGPRDAFPGARSAVADLVVDLRPTEVHEPKWHWLHMDLDVKHWFRNFGHSVNFDFVLDYEWDILTTAPLLSIYPEMDQHTIALCSLTRLTPEVERSWGWTGLPEYRPSYERFIDYMQRRFGIARLEYVSHGPGTILPRGFLERFAAVDDVELVISEIKYPAYAQAFGFGIVDNNLRPSAVTDTSEDAVFNSVGRAIAYERILTELLAQDGRRAFHPVKYSFPLGHVRRLQRLSTGGRLCSRAEVVRLRLVPPVDFMRHMYPSSRRSRTALLWSYLRRLLGRARCKFLRLLSSPDRAP